MWLYESAWKKDSGKARSYTFNGIARAMAEQWTEYLTNKN
jgi:hypothetical protein